MEGALGGLREGNSETRQLRCHRRQQALRGRLVQVRDSAADDDEAHPEEHREPRVDAAGRRQARFCADVHKRRHAEQERREVQRKCARIHEGGHGDHRRQARGGGCLPGLSKADPEETLKILTFLKFILRKIELSLRNKNFRH